MITDYRKPFKALGFRWKEGIGMSYCPYMYRWVFNFYFFSIRIHHWLRSDDKRAFHDHPWSFITIVTKGSYTDVSESGKEVLTRGSIRYRVHNHKHYVEVPESGCWSVLLTGRPNHKWGFLKDGKYMKKNKYFKKHGHPACDDQ
jgi:hypothetical protein